MGEVKVMSPFFPSLPEAEPGVMSDLAKGPPTLKGTTKDWGGETNYELLDSWTS